jgi:hypothetical protein
MSLRVVLEVAPKKTFASALDWPGWARAGRTGDDALRALLDYAPRYAAVTKRARIAFAQPKTFRGLTVVETLPGDGGTEFGVPGAAARAEEELLTAAELKRLIALLRASWSTLDSAARRAAGVELTTGPRGGGRDLAKMLGHVREAEGAYLGKLGSRAPASADEDPVKLTARLRRTFTDALTAVASGQPVADPRGTHKLWGPRYAVRRAAWHVLDHAWEIQDRSGT